MNKSPNLYSYFIITLIIHCSLFIIHSQAQDNASPLTIKYKVHFEGSTEKSESILEKVGSYLVMSYDGVFSRMEVIPSEAGDIVIINAKKEEMIMLINRQAVKRAVYFPELSLLKNDSLVYVKKNIYKEIAGFQCEKILFFHCMDTLEAYSSNEIGRKMKFQPEKIYNGFNDVLLEFEMMYSVDDENYKIRYTAIEMNNDSIEAVKFSIPSDHKIIPIDKFLGVVDEIVNDTSQIVEASDNEKNEKQVVAKDSITGPIYDSLDLVLFKASKNGNIENVAEALSGGANVNAKFENKNSPIIEAALNNHFMVVKLLCKNGADINSLSTFHTPLSAAVENGNRKIIDFLLEKSVDINQRTIFNTPLMVAAEKGRFQLVDLLLKKGADINGYSPFCTVLMKTCEVENYEMVKYLIAKKLDINARTEYGTPLIMAVKIRNYSLVKLLIDEGADISAIDKEGMAAINYAINNKDLEIIKLLSK